MHQPKLLILCSDPRLCQQLQDHMSDEITTTVTELSLKDQPALLDDAPDLILLAEPDITELASITGFPTLVLTREHKPEAETAFYNCGATACLTLPELEATPLLTTVHRAVAAFHAERAERDRAVSEQVRERIVKERLDALGRLAGGVAHDFNNLVMIVSTYCGFIRRALPRDHGVLPDLRVALDAVERIAALTRELMVFGRKRTTRDVVVELNRALGDPDGIHRRYATPLHGIEVQLSPEAGRVCGDVAQIDQVLEQLVTNAQESMPGGGTVAVESARLSIPVGEHCMNGDEIPAGAYAALTVRDTGCGIAPEILPHIFEPFFTTKEVGKGSGLGLSMVYGVARQHGAFLVVESEPEMGASVRLLFPHTDAAETRNPHPGSTTTAMRGTERILLCEDEEFVREGTRRILENRGYAVVAASDPLEAAAIAKDLSTPFDLLLTDLVMPGMSGRELAGIFRKARPKQPVLYMSGHERDALPAGHDMEDDALDLAKPFSQQELLMTIRLAIDREQAEEDATNRRHILAVEDEDFVGHALRRILEGAGHRVTCVGTAEEAETLLKREDHGLTAVLCDLNLPGQSGIDLYAWLCAHDRTLAETFFLLTGDPYDERLVPFAATLEGRILPKPLDSDALLAQMGVDASRQRSA